MLCPAFTVLLATSLATPQEPRTSEVFSLQSLCAPPPPVLTPAWGTLLIDGRDRPPTNLVLADSEQNPMLQPDDVVDLLRTWSAGATEAGRLELHAEGQQLTASGERAEIAIVRERLKALALRTNRPVQIELCVWDAADRESPVAVLDAAAYLRFAGNRDPLWRCVTTTRHGIAVALEHMRWSRYVGDVDVEVAQKQTMNDPVVRTYGEGTEAIVRPFQLAGGDDYVLHVQFALGQRRGPVRSVATGVPNSPEIELPTLETAFGAFSGRVTNGGALAATLRGHASTGSAHIVTVRVVARTPVANTLQDGTVVLPIGALVSDGLTQRATPCEDFHDDSVPGEPQPGHDYFHPDRLTDLIRAELGSDADSVGLRCMGGWLVASGSPELLAKIAASLQRLQDAAVRTVTFRHVTPIKPGPDEDAATAPNLQDLTLPTLAGRELTIGRGLEMPVLADINVEIAGEAGVLDPLVRLAQSGCWLRARVAPVGDDMDLQMTLLGRHLAQPQSRSVMPGGMLMPTETWFDRANHAGTVGNGATVELGDGPTVLSEGRARRTSQTISLRW
ncbi:MAG: hypothetical protein JNK15_15865 [Planctomycetes bacterium]|nr:hypothetical protein [Planctomycetota bacterium]